MAGGRAIKKCSLITVWAESSACPSQLPAGGTRRRRQSDLGDARGSPGDGDGAVGGGRFFSAEIWEGQTNGEVSREHAKHVGFPSPTNKKKKKKNPTAKETELRPQGRVTAPVPTRAEKRLATADSAGKR